MENPFFNPFLNIDKEKLILLQEDRSENYILVPKYEFFIISETKISEKKMVWFDLKDRRRYFDIIFQSCDWREIYVWDKASLELRVREDDPTYIDIVVGPTDDCDHTSVRRSINFLDKIATEVNKQIDEFHEGLVMLQFENLYIDSLNRDRKPISIWKRDDTKK